MSNLFTFPVSFLLLELFRRSNKKNPKTKRLKKTIKDLYSSEISDKIVQISDKEGELKKLPSPEKAVLR